MKKRSISKSIIILLSLLLVSAMMPAGVSAEQHHQLFTPNEGQITLTPAKDGTRLAETIEKLGGSDGLYGQGLNGFDMYDHLGYVYLGWRTTGGRWQNRVIGDYIMNNLEAAGYETTDADVQAPYGTKPASDKSSASDGDYAWLIQYQGTEEKELGDTWDPEYASLDVQLVDKDGKPVNDAEADKFAKDVSGKYWGYDPETEAYQKNFADLFGIDYAELKAFPESERILKMRDTLMSSDIDRDSRKSVDDYKNIKRDSIGEPNKETVLNKRTKLAWNSCFTDPAGTDPAEAAGLDGEVVYVGETYGARGNSEGIPDEELRGKIILTDSTMYSGYYYASKVGAIGAASRMSMEGFLCPKDENGDILEPWYDSSRYAEGCGLDETVEQMDAGEPIIEWQFSNKQFDSLKALLARADEINKTAASGDDKVRVTGRQIAIGQIYPMTKTEGKPGKGQAVAIAEVKGAVHPEKRILICAHVQEPGCGDNATGVGSLLGMATAYKKMIDDGKIERPDCTITFMWGDEMNMASFWMDGHKEEKADLIGALDMDMTGQDPEKTGGVMRIEKTPDPSAIYGYTCDAVPWKEPDEYIPSELHPYYDETYKNRYGDFTRLPDSDTLWGAGYVGEEIFQRGWYLNDLYMYVTSTVIDRHDKDFRVDVCPYEGGSDHSVFLKSGVPALLTWHFTDYTYHTSSDTLYMASPRELESVGITTLVSALMISDSQGDADAAADILGAVKEAGLKRMAAEAVNTDHHLIYAKAGNTTIKEALANEKEVLNAWGIWYDAALESVATLYDGTSEALNKAIDDARSEMSARTAESIQYAETVLAPEARQSVKDAIVTGLGNRIYTGKAIKPEIKVILGGRTLKAGTDYQLRYADNKNVGKAKIVITGIGNYTGSKTVTFKILPKTTKITSRKGIKGGFSVKWKKQKVQTSGYQVRWSLKSNMYRAKKKLIKSRNKIKFKKTGLKRNRKYYVQVRTYKVVNGEKYYSVWSVKKSVKTK